MNPRSAIVLNTCRRSSGGKGEDNRKSPEDGERGEGGGVWEFIAEDSNVRV